MEYEIEPDRASFQRVITALKAETESKALLRDLRKGMKAALEPAAAQARENILSMPITGRLSHVEEPLRAAIAANVVVDVSLSAKSPKVGLKAKKTKGLRGFPNAPKRMNAYKGFRHPLFGNRERWFKQVGAPGWFDRAHAGREDKFKAAVAAALKAVADRISRRA